MSSEPLPSNNISKILTAGAIVVALVFLILFGLYLLTFSFSLSPDQAVWGALGDYIGGLLNPLISFLALIALIKTVSLQYDALRITKQEWQASQSLVEDQIEQQKAAHQELLKNEKEKLEELQQRQEQEKLETVTKAFINEYYSKDFSLHRAAVWNITQKVLQGKVSIAYIVNGFIQSSQEPYFVGDEYHGYSEYNHLALYISFIDKLGYAITNNDVDIEEIKSSLGYDLQWHRNIILTIAIEAGRAITKGAGRDIANEAVRDNANVADRKLLDDLREEANSDLDKPSFIKNGHALYKCMKCNPALPQIEPKHKPIKASERNASTDKLAIVHEQEKRELVFKLHSDWSSPPMREKRMCIWQAFIRYYAKPYESDEQILFSELKQKFSDKEEAALTELFMFFSDLKKIIQAGLLDRELSSVLLEHSVNSWQWYITRLVYDLDDCEYEREVKNWFEGDVRGLFKLLSSE